MSEHRYTGDVRVVGGLHADSMTLPNSSVANATVASDAAIERTKLAQDTLQVYPVPWSAFRVWDDIQSILPDPSANDDLGLIGGTFATDSPSLQSSDLKAAGATSLYARCMIAMPIEYEAASSVEIRLSAGMLTTVADTSATVDIECYKSDREAGIGADLCADAAQSCNSLTLADKDFTITATTLSPGDILDVRITMAINDAATGTTVQGIIGSVELLCDVRG